MESNGMESTGLSGTRSRICSEDVAGGFIGLTAALNWSTAGFTGSG